MQVIEISARNVQLEKRGAFGKGKVTAKIPAFSAHLPEVKLEKEAMRAYTGYVIQDGHINQLDAHRMIAEGVQSTFRRGFEHRLTEKVRVWAQAYYKNYPHLYDSKSKRLKGFRPEVIAAHFVMLKEQRTGKRGNVDMRGVIADMADAADRERFENA